MAADCCLIVRHSSYHAAVSGPSDRYTCLNPCSNTSALIVRCRFAGIARRECRFAPVSSAASEPFQAVVRSSPRAAASSGRTTETAEARAENSRSSDQEKGSESPPANALLLRFLVQTCASTGAGQARRALSGGWDAQAGDWDACPIPSTAPLASCPWRSRAISILGTPAFPVLCRTISGNAHESRAMERAEPKYNLPTPSKGAATLPCAASHPRTATSENP